MFKLFSFIGVLLLVFVVGGVLMLASSGAYATDCPIPDSNGNTAAVSGECNIYNPIQPVSSIPDLICKFIQLLTEMLMPPIMVLMVLWASFLLLTSVGQPAKLTQARAMLLYAIIGSVVLIMATPLVALVGSALGGAINTTSCNVANATTSALTVLANIINWFSWLLAILSVAMGLYAGFLYMTAKGEPQKVATANNVLFYTVIGVVVAILAFSIITIMNAFIVTGGGG